MNSYLKRLFHSREKFTDTRMEQLKEVETRVIAELKRIEFPFEIITKHHGVIAGGFIRCLHLNLPYRDIDLFVNQCDMNDVENCLWSAGFRKIDTPATMSVVKFSKKLFPDNEVIIDIKKIPTRCTFSLVYELMDLTHCMISFGEVGSLTISTCDEYLRSILEKKVFYNTKAIWEPIGTLSRLDKFAKAGWNVASANAYVRDRQLKEIKYTAREDWCGS